MAEDKKTPSDSTDKNADAASDVETSGAGTEAKPAPTPADAPARKDKGYGLYFGLVVATAAVVIAAFLGYVGLREFGYLDGTMLGRAGSADTEAVSEAVTALEARVAGLEADLAAERARTEELQAEVESGAAGAGGDDGRLAAALDLVTDIEARLAALEEGAGSADGGASAELVGALETRLEAQEKTAEALRADIEAVRAELPPENLTARMDNIAAQTGQTAGEIAAVGREVGEITQGLAAANDTLAQVGARVAAIEEELARPDMLHQAALSVALGNLASAVRGSESFEEELSAVRELAPSETRLDALSDVATRGMPTRATLTRSFGDLSRDILRAEAAGAGDGVWDRLLGNAKSIVTVRRTGEVPGEETEAIVARMEQRLEAGDLAAAVAEGEKLQGLAAEAAAPWLEAARERLEMEALVRTLNAELLSELGQRAG